MDNFNTGYDVHFLSQSDWRSSDVDDDVEDDEELTQTPSDVIEILGFDPLELAGDKNGNGDT